MNLGERLRQIKIDTENKNTARQRREEEIKRENVVKEISTLRGYFDRAWREATAAIEDELLPKGIKVMGYGMPFRYSGNIIPDNVSHPYHDVYLDYVTLGEQNGLDLKIFNEHDGCGMSDWYRVIFTI